MSYPRYVDDADSQVGAAEPPVGQTKGEWLLGELRQMATTMLPGEVFPSDRVLAHRFQAARMTVRGQVDTLVDEGLLRRRPGRGTFVQRPDAVISDSPASLSFSTEMKARGLRPSSKILAFRRTSPGPSDRQVLGVAPGDSVLQIARVRYADGAPMALGRVRLPAALVPGMTRSDLEQRSLHELLSTDYGIVAATAEQTVTVAWPRAADLAWLELPDGAATLCLERVTRDAGGRVIESARSYYRPDRYQVHMHVEVDRRR